MCGIHAKVEDINTKVEEELLSVPMVQTSLKLSLMLWIQVILEYNLVIICIINVYIF